MQTITKYLLFVFILLIISISPSRSQNLQRDFSCQVDSVLSLMTLEEKTVNSINIPMIGRIPDR